MAAFIVFRDGSHRELHTGESTTGIQTYALMKGVNGISFDLDELERLKVILKSVNLPYYDTGRTKTINCNSLAEATLIHLILKHW